MNGRVTLRVEGGRALAGLLALMLAGCSAAPATGGPAAPAPPLAAPATPTTQPQRTAAAPASPTAIEPVGVRLGILGTSSDVALYIAVDKAFFAEHGIVVEPEPMNSAAQMIAPLGAGQMDVGGGTPSPGLFNAIQRGIPVRIVADKGRHARGRAFEGLVVRPELVERGTFRDVADLKGRPVAISSQGSTGEIVLDTALKRVGLSSNDLELANLAFPDMPSALAGGSVDAAMIIEPFLATVLEKNLGVLWKRTDEIIPDFQAAVVLYGPQFVVVKPDVARRFMLAYVKASRYYNDAVREKGSPAWNELVDILIKNTRIKDRAVYDQMGLPGLDPDASLNVDSIRDMQDWWLERGLQDERIDLTRAIDQSFAQHAARELGPYRQ